VGSKWWLASATAKRRQRVIKTYDLTLTRSQTRGVPRPKSLQTSIAVSTRERSAYVFSSCFSRDTLCHCLLRKTPLAFFVILRERIPSSLAGPEVPLALERRETPFGDSEPQESSQRGLSARSWP